MVLLEAPVVRVVVGVVSFRLVSCVVSCAVCRVSCVVRQFVGDGDALLLVVISGCRVW